METTTFRYRSKFDDPYSSHSLILSLAGPGAGKRLLDVGAAQGTLAERFTERGFEVTGIEGDATFAQAAAGTCKQLFVSDLDGSLPPLEGVFDVIVYGDVLEHLKAPDQVFHRLNAYLAPGGKVIVSVPNIAHLWVRLNLLRGRFPYMDRGILDRTHLRFFTLNSFLQFVRDDALRIESVGATPVPLPLVVPPRYHGRLFRLIHRASAALARAWKAMFGYQFVVVARRQQPG